MGRLDKALDRIKKRGEANSHGKSSVPRRAPTSQLENRVLKTDGLADSARSILLDNEFLAGNRIVTHAIDPAVRTSYKMLRTRLLQNMRTNGWQSLAVTSATQGDGKTVTAINLALSIAGDVNHNVCLVDLDLRHSSIGDYLGLALKNGVSDCLQRNLAISEVMLKPNVDRMLILPNLIAETSSSEILSSPKAQSLAAELTRDPNRIVIYDMPPVLAADDMLAFSPNVDAVLFVVAESVTARTDVLKAYELLDNLTIIGTVLNRSDEKTASYY